MAVRVPATSANLGPGFDALGLAVSLHCTVGIVDTDIAPEGAQIAEDGHPAQVAFIRAGGNGRVWTLNNIPMGRGLGFSGAARIGGAVAAEVQHQGSLWSLQSSAALELCTELEGHADNVAPSLHGGVVATTAGKVVRIPFALDAAFIAWVPSFTTSTNESRGKIGPTISLDDAVYNIGHTALLVAAFAAGDVGALAEATKDRIHQEIRFAMAEPSRVALHAALEAGAWCGWLSGSGPTVMSLCAPADAARIAAALPSDGHAKVLSLDTAGAVVL